MFDESQLDCDGDAVPGARNELGILDARGMKTVVEKILLPQRVPYGFHGRWFSRAEIEGQRPFSSSRRAQIQAGETPALKGMRLKLWFEKILEHGKRE